MNHLPVVRDRSDARIAGVCAALARSWQMDPLVLRVAFVALALLTGGFIVAAYLALWALLPLRGSETEPVRRLLPFTRLWSTPTLVAVVVVVATVLGGLVTGAGPGAFVIIVLAWVILRFGFAGRRASGAGARPATEVQATPQTPFERLSLVWQQRLDNVAAGRPSDWEPESTDPDPAGLYGPAELPESAAVAPAGRRRGLRTWLAIAVGLGTVWSALAITDAMGVPVPELAWVASTLAVFGLALVAVSRPSRAAWSRPPMLLAATIVTALVTAPMLVPEPVRLASVAADEVVPVGVAALEGSHQLPIGEHVIDLSDQAVTTDSVASYHQDLGDLTLVVPSEGNVVVRSHVDLGEIRTPFETADAMDTELTWSRITDPDGPTLTVDLRVGLGEIVVQS